MISGVFVFDPSDPVYQVHFPGNPVVPGSLIIRAFTETLERSGIPVDGSGIQKFRFRTFLNPGEYSYQIIKGENGYKCTLFDGEKKVATGEINDNV